MKVGRAITKYGFDSIKVSTLASSLTHEAACALEIALIKEFDTYKSGYNSSLGGEGVTGVPAWNVGIPVTREQKLKYAESRECREFRAINRETGKEVWRGLLQTECLTALGFPQSYKGNLNTCLSGQRKTIAGIYFEYLDEPKSARDVSKHLYWEDQKYRSKTTKAMSKATNKRRSEMSKNANTLWADSTYSDKLMTQRADPAYREHIAKTRGAKLFEVSERETGKVIWSGYNQSECCRFLGTTTPPKRYLSGKLTHDYLVFRYT